MAEETSVKEGGSSIVIGISIVLAVGVAALAFYFETQSRKSETELKRSIEDYRKMAETMKKPVEDLVKNRKRSPEAVTDPLTFLDRKAREAQIPANLFNIARNQPLTTGQWQEQSYTVTLRATKETPVRRGAVVDFLRLVETQQRSTKSKNLQLTFSGEDFSQVTATFSSFVPK